jgi:hypothetical protein
LLQVHMRSLTHRAAGAGQQLYLRAAHGPSVTGDWNRGF